MGKEGFGLFSIAMMRHCTEENKLAQLLYPLQQELSCFGNCDVTEI